MKYRKLRKYKYQLTENYFVETNITGFSANNKFIGLNKTGNMVIFQGYSWDGPSGPTIDTEAFIKASLVHDAFYQLFREKKLPLSLRIKADKFLYKECIQYGMWKIRALWVYWAVRIFGKSSAKDSTKGEINK